MIRVNLIVEPKSNTSNPLVVVVPSYGNLRPGCSKVNMCLRNLSIRNLRVKIKLIVAQVVTAKMVPPMLTAKNSQESEKHEDTRMKTPEMNSEAPIKVQLTRDQLKQIV